MKAIRWEQIPLKEKHIERRYSNSPGPATHHSLLQSPAPLGFSTFMQTVPLGRTRGPNKSRFGGLGARLRGACVLTCSRRWV